MDLFQGSGSVLGTNHILTEIEDKLSIEEDEGIFEPTTLRWRRVVFPSFFRADFCRPLLSHMLKELTINRIGFIFYNDMKRCMSLGPPITTTIKDSIISIVLITKNYASSTSCLEELALIMECREELGHKVITMFYGVERSDVKEQRGYFGSVFKETCVGKSEEDVEKWKHALEEVAQIPSYNSREWLVILIYVP